MRTIGLEIAAKAGFAAATANGAFAALGNTVCNQVTIYNNSGVALSIRYKGQTVSLSIDDGQALPLRGIGSAGQIEVKRTDGVGTVVNFVYYYEGV